MPLPNTSVVQSGAKGSVELPNDGHNDSTEQVVQSDDVDVAEECAFSSTQTFTLRSANVMKWLDLAGNHFSNINKKKARLLKRIHCCLKAKDFEITLFMLTIYFD